MKNLFMLSMIILTVTSCKTKSSNPFDGKYQTTNPPITQFEIRDGNFSLGGGNLSYIHGSVDRSVFKASDATTTQFVLLKLSNNQLFASSVFDTQKEAEESSDPKFSIIAKKI